MPIAFPPAVQGHPRVQARNLYINPLGFVPSPNRGNPGVKFDWNGLNGPGRLAPRPNAASPGVNFARAFAIPVDQRPQMLTDGVLWKEISGTFNILLSIAASPRWLSVSLHIGL